MDLDAYVAAHQAEWRRLEDLVKRVRGLRGAEVDELVELYQRVATHLSVLQSAGNDAALVGRLSSLVARARSAVAGTRQAAWRDALRLLAVDFPAVVYRARWWWLGVMAGSLLVAVAAGAWLDTHPEVQRQLISQQTLDQLVNHDFADYYKQAPAQDFASKVFTNNAQIAAACILLGVFLGLPVLYVLATNALNVGLAGGLLASRGRLDLFFGLILPHGMLELTAVFVAGGLGLKLGWTVVDPGRRTRAAALAEEGRALVTGALGLALTLFVSGLIEGFVTPSGWPTAVRIGIGAVAEALFLTWVLVLGRRAARAGVTGDVEQALRGDVLPTA
ncbi:MAG: stage II sporulation protein M [Mycobacteriales bacterium]